MYYESDVTFVRGRASGQSRAESTWEINIYGKYINQFLPNTIKSILQYERINKKLYRQKMSIIFNEICINEEMLPKYTYIYKILFGPVKPELGVIPSGQENHSKPEHLNFPGRELNVINITEQHFL